MTVILGTLTLMALAAMAGPEPAAAQETGGSAPGQPAASAPAGPIASTDGEQPGMRIDVTELKRGSGGTVTLRLTLVNASTEPYKLASNLSLSGLSYNVSGIYLLDPANRKKHHTIMAADDRCVCSSDLQSTVKAGEAVNLWAKFPAPPADVTEVGVVVPHFIPMDAVPIAP